MNSKNNGAFHLSKKTKSSSFSVLTKAALILSLAVFLIPIIIPASVTEGYGGKRSLRYARYQKQSTIVSTATTTIKIASSTPLASSGTLTTTMTNSTVSAPASTTTSALPVTTTVAPVVPTTTTTSVNIANTIPTGSKLCMNYGHQPTVDGKYNSTEVDANFVTLKNAGINCIRMAYNGFNNPNTNAIALRAKATGISVIVGGDWGTLTPTDLATYETKALTQAKWAEANGIPQFGIGNEQEYRLSGLSQDEWVVFVKSLAQKVKGVYSGVVSYETSSDFLPLWQKHGLGSIDKLGLNNYCGFSCNSSRIAKAIQSFGSDHVYVSETNADMDTGLYNSDSAHAAAIQKDTLELLKIYSIPMYYFAFTSGGTAPLHWGLYTKTQSVQPLTASVLGFK